ncbi:hypothetical protein PYCC9005_003617 [Savitreella phatthalungensis]
MDISRLESFRQELESGLASRSFDKSQLEWALLSLDAFQEQPQILDASIPGWLDQISQELRSSLKDRPLSDFASALYSVIYKLMKVRSWKLILKFLPNDVHLLESVLALLESLPQEGNNQWRTRYVLLLWLSLIAITPFDLASVSAEPLVERLIAAGQAHLDFSGIERNAAAELLARVLTRKDVHVKYLPPFLINGQNRLTKASIHFKCGFMHAVTIIYKVGNRDILAQHVDRALALAEALEELPEFATDSLLHKLRVKLAQRISLSMLPPNLAAWRYSNVEKVYDTNKLISPAAEVLTEPPEAVETTVGWLIADLADSSTDVRFSAAKGLARIASRIPEDFATEIVIAICETLRAQTAGDHTQLYVIETATEPTWNGSCLALAELCRTGALLPKMLDDVLPLVFAGLRMDIRKGTYSLGNGVRDAACYVIWSVVRSFRSALIEHWLHRIAFHLVTTSLFDREVSVRRAASAAFQETVGRRPDLIPHGIQVMSIADFIAVGQRRTAFGQLAPQIFAFEAYRMPILDYLLTRSCTHWDKETRTVAAECLSRLTHKHPDVVPHVMDAITLHKSSSDVNARHGAMLAAAALVSASTKSTDSTFKHDLVIFAADLDHASNFAGLSSALMLQGLCKYTAEICRLLGPDLAKGEQDAISGYEELAWQASLHVDEETRDCGATAFSTLCPFLPDTQIEARIAQIESTTHPAKRRGLMLLLGKLVFPNNLAHLADRAFNHLLATARSKGDPEVRALATSALGRHCEGNATHVQADVVLPALAECLQDYTVDARGDVGSWTREAAIGTALTLVCHLSASVSSESLEAVITGAVQQCFGKIDNLRVAAVTQVSSLLNALIASDRPNLISSSALNDIQAAAPLLSACASALTAGAPPESTFSALIDLLSLDLLRTACLRELLIAAAAGGHSTLLASHNALMFNLAQHDAGAIVTSIVTILRDPSTDDTDRVIPPVIKATAALIDSNTLNLTDPTPLFDATQSSTLNARSFNRVASALDMYGVLAPLVGSGAGERAWKRLVCAVGHRTPRVRGLAAEKLWIVVDRLSDELPNNHDLQPLASLLAHTDFTQPLNTLTHTLNTLKQAQYPR